MAFRYNADTQQFRKFIFAASNLVVGATNNAVRDTAAAAVAAGRQSIAGAGFNKTWQNSLQFKMMTPKDSLEPKAYIHTTINYADVFETGKTITGNPWLWLPLPSVPRNTGSGLRFGGVVAREHMTPRQYISKVGPLVSLHRPGKPPLLAAPIRRGAKVQPFDRFATRAQLRRGTKGRGKTEMIPMFVGVHSIFIKKVWDVTAAMQKASEQMPDFYEDELRKLDAQKLLQG